MKQERSLKEQLQEKFKELPVKDQAADDWQKLKKVLNVAMPVTVLSSLFHAKVWFAKKLVWVYLLGVGISGSTALVIYYLQRSKKNTAQTANKDTVVVQKDTMHLKHPTTLPISAKDTAIHKRDALRSVTSIDNTTRKYKSIPPQAPQDTLPRKHKAVPPPPQKDTTTHKRKMPPPTPMRDTLPKKTKKQLHPNPYNHKSTIV